MIKVESVIFIIRKIYRIPREGDGTPLQYSCLENPMARGAWWATVHGVTKSWAQLSTYTQTPVTVLGSVNKKSSSGDGVVDTGEKA